jgi:hypothetical protein
MKRAQKYLSGLAIAAQPVFVPLRDRSRQSGDGLLYLVVMIAANTKYSVNRRFIPAPPRYDCNFP